MMKRTSFTDKRFSFFLVLALLLHALVLTLHLKQKRVAVETEPTKLKPIDLKLIELRTTKQQIVASEDPDTFETPEDAKFLSDKNRRFDRQTRAQNGNEFRKSSYTGPSASQRKKVTLSDLGVPTGDVFKPGPKPSLASQGKRTLSTTSDFLADVPLGDVTHLNTKEFKYYGFYQRIRQKLEQFWGRSIQETAEELARNGRRVPASENLITSLEVTLDENGEIIAIKVIGPSGMRELDDAAIESFNDAGPFPHPPRDLIVDDKVVIEWGFVIQS